MVTAKMSPVQEVTNPGGVLILGCGDLGMRVRRRLLAQGIPVTGIRRHAQAGDGLIAGDAADPAMWDQLPGGPWRAALLSATPGLRRGRDNGLAAAAALMARRLPGARLVYSGTTSVYGGIAGTLDEDSPVDRTDPAIVGLLAIEQTLGTHRDSLVLRFPAIVGAGRNRVRNRLLAGDYTVTGDLDKPFNFIHQEDAAALCVEALLGCGGTGVVNAVAPFEVSMREYYAAHALAVGVDPALLTGELPGERVNAAARLVRSNRFDQRFSPRPWRYFDDPDAR